MQRRKSRRGSVLVEFAVVAPILFLFFFSVFEFGRLVMARQSLDESVRAACRVAILDGATDDEIDDAADTILTMTGISNYTLTKSPDPPSSAQHLDPITISITAPYDDISWLPLPMFLSGANLSASCTLPRESSVTSEP